MLFRFRKQKYLIEYLVKFKYQESDEILETKAYIYSNSNPKTSIPKLFPGIVVLNYELTGETIGIQVKNNQVRNNY